jgi:acyl-CoA thioesterase
MAELSETEAQALAERSVAALRGRSGCTEFLNMQLESIAPGRGAARMRVTAQMLNGIGTCHGGIIFTLADEAFGYACNSRNQLTTGAACGIDYVKAAFEGDELVAEALERSLAGRTGVYDVEVRNQHGELIALMRGKSHRTRHPVIQES